MEPAEWGQMWKEEVKEREFSLMIINDNIPRNTLYGLPRTKKNNFIRFYGI